ncbi:xylose isomerase-like protein [Microthyrium microscopicum]|uniref:Xylose isomerase-like protein n=1 Tax=Microthyrium microscopicum TaxID=703497 RepID=A0A6A6UPB6_9PEZI|nr:xylose isomerase-like protein [Microthyrium microscopicum]
MDVVQSHCPIHVIAMLPFFWGKDANVAGTRYDVYESESILDEGHRSPQQGWTAKIGFSRRTPVKFLSGLEPGLLFPQIGIFNASSECTRSPQIHLHLSESYFETHFILPLDPNTLSSAIKMRHTAAISSMSLGRAWLHDLPHKLDQAKRYGLKGIELFYEDLEYVAKDFPGETKDSSLIAASRHVRTLCDQRGLEIICLQPFMHYEGLRDRAHHQQRVAEMKLWLKLANILGTQLILIPSSFLPEDEITDDLDVIVADLREVAELGLAESPPIRFAYEALCWGTYINTWEQSWDIVTKVEMPNFGICIDTFNIAGRVYADPASTSGTTQNADVDSMMSTQRLRNTLDVRKVFLVQLVDAARLKTPMGPGHEEYNPSQKARMSWSRGHRLFYGEQQLGGYLPVLDILKAVLDLGYEGWISAELFNNLMSNPAPEVPQTLAKRAAISWQKLLKDLGARSPQAETRL